MTSQSPSIANRHALVLGATGSFGAHMTAALIAKGWTITAMARDPADGRARAGVNMPIEWVKGDAMIAADVAAAARGASLIVHAVNPPRYRNWAGTVMPMLEAAIGAAKREGARILIPGTVYNYAPSRGPRITEDTPQAPVTRKGAIRATLERRLATAAAEEGIKSLVMRAGDFYGPAAPNSALAWLAVKLRGEVRATMRPGPADVGHAFAYLPDLTRAAAMVLERQADLAAFETFHFAGDWLTPIQLRDALRMVEARPSLPSIPFPWMVLHAMAPFDETMREMLEMRYLWRRPIGLDGGKLDAFLGGTPRTPLETALRVTFADDEETLSSRARSADAGPLRWTPAISTR